MNINELTPDERQLILDRRQNTGIAARQAAMCRHWFGHAAPVLCPLDTPAPTPKMTHTTMYRALSPNLEIIAYNHGYNGRLHGSLRYINDGDHRHGITFYINEDAAPDTIRTVAQHVLDLSTALDRTRPHNNHTPEE